MSEAFICSSDPFSRKEERLKMIKSDFKYWSTFDLWWGEGPDCDTACWTPPQVMIATSLSTLMSSSFNNIWLLQISLQEWWWCMMLELGRCCLTVTRSCRRLGIKFHQKEVPTVHSLLDTEACQRSWSWLRKATVYNYIYYYNNLHCIHNTYSPVH